MTWRTDQSDYDTMEIILADMRSNGWRVAIHNDYDLAGSTRTFWLFTHFSGAWAKGESYMDQNALAIARAQAQQRKVHDEK
jgi:hypothetical protein